MPLFVRLQPLKMIAIVLWLRIFPRNGLVVSCPPPPPHIHQAKSRNSELSASPGPAGVNCCFGNSRNSNEETCGKSAHYDARLSCFDGRNAPSRRGVLPNHPSLIINTAVIPCGQVVEAEPWEEHSNDVLRTISPETLESVSILF